MSSDWFYSLFNDGFRDKRRHDGFEAFDFFDGIMRQMDQFMRGDSDMNSFVDHFVIENPQIKPSEEARSLRSQMLKSADDEKAMDSFGRSDVDLDDRVAKYGFRDVFTESEPRKGLFTFSHNSSMKTFVSSDGRVEERHIERDAHGNKVETIKRSLGNQSFTIRRKENPNGIIEEDKTLFNLSEDELPSFEKHWNNQCNTNTIAPVQHVQQNSNPFENLKNYVFSFFKK